ncbi:MAG: hypothetical protein AB1716_19030 [Planctomycetota bacterium]
MSDVSREPLRGAHAPLAAPGPAAPEPAAPELAVRQRARWPLLVAIAGVVTWYFAVNICLAHVLGDEMYHFPMVQALARGESPPRKLPMPLTYHYVASFPVRIVAWVQGAGGSSPDVNLWAVRAFQATVAIAVLLLYRELIRLRHPEDGERRLLLFAWNPLVFPFFVLVYTDVASLAALLLAVYAHLRGRRGWACVALVAACALRQSNLVWVACVATWRLVEALSALQSEADTASKMAGRYGALLRAVLRENLWVHVLIVAGAALFLYRWGGLVLSPDAGNQPAFNRAQLYLFGIVLAIVWLPRWGPAVVGNIRNAVIRPGTARRAAGSLLPGPVASELAVGAALGGAALAAVGLAGLYANVHEWNQELTFLHNWPLRIMADSRAAALAGAALLVAFAAGQFVLTRRSAAAGLLAMLWLFAIVFLLPHFPADARYYIIPLVLLDFFTPYTPREVGRLAAWYAVLTTGVAAFVLSRPTVYGGL